MSVTTYVRLGTGEREHTSPLSIWEIEQRLDAGQCIPVVIRGEEVRAAPAGVVYFFERADDEA